MISETKTSFCETKKKCCGEKTDFETEIYYFWDEKNDFDAFKGDWGCLLTLNLILELWNSIWKMTFDDLSTIFVFWFDYQRRWSNVVQNQFLHQNAQFNPLFLSKTRFCLPKKLHSVLPLFLKTWSAKILFSLSIIIVLTSRTV